jgi:hypothetical protein
VTLTSQTIAAETAEQAETMARDQAQHNGLSVLAVKVLRGQNGLWEVQTETKDTPLTS